MGHRSTTATSERTGHKIVVIEIPAHHESRIGDELRCGFKALEAV
jgi:hypothetical protein